MSAMDEARAKRDAREARLAEADIKALTPFAEKFDALMDEFAKVNARLRSNAGRTSGQIITRNLQVAFDHLEQLKEG